MKAGTEFYNLLTSPDYFQKQHTKSFRCFCPNVSIAEDTIFIFFLFCSMKGQYHKEIILQNNSVQNPDKTSYPRFQEISDLPVMGQDPRTLTVRASSMAAINHGPSSSITFTYFQPKPQKWQSGTELKDHCNQGLKSDSQRDSVMHFINFKSRFSYFIPRNRS